MKWNWKNPVKPLKVAVLGDTEWLRKMLTPADFEAIQTKIEAVPIWQKAAAITVCETLIKGGMRSGDIVEHGLPVVLGLSDPLGPRMDAGHAAECVATVCAIGCLSGPQIRLAKTVIEVCIRGY